MTSCNMLQTMIECYVFQHVQRNTSTCSKRHEVVAPRLVGVVCCSSTMCLAGLLGRQSDVTSQKTSRWTKVVLMLGQRRRRWPNTRTTLVQHLVSSVVSMHLWCQRNTSCWFYVGAMSYMTTSSMCSLDIQRQVGNVLVSHSTWTRRW